MKGRKILALMLTVFMVLTIVPCAMAAEGKIKVACVGDSLTAGLVGADGNYTQEKSYVDILSEKLGDEYEVKNFGIPSRGLYKEHKYPYFDTEEYKNAKAFGADIVISLFGTNDAKVEYWEGIKDSYQTIYEDFIKEFEGARVIIGIPSPVFGDSDYAKDRPSENMSGMREAVKKAAVSLKAETVDFNALFEGKAEIFPDGLHWREEGALSAAESLIPLVKKAGDKIKNEGNISKKEEAALGTVKALGIMEKSVAALDEITRGEYVSLLINILGVDGAFMPNNCHFTDIDGESEIAGDISVAVGLGLISGFGDNTFRPDERVTVAQAVKMLTSLMGYDVYATANGGYPAGYLMCASSLGILKGIDADSGRACTAVDAAVMIYNALEVPLLQNTRFPEGEYKAIEGDTMLSKWLRIAKDEGIVNGTEITSLYGEKEQVEGYVKIGESIYAKGESEADKLFGLRAMAYHKETDDGKDTLLYVTEKGESEETIVQSDDIDFINTDYAEIYSKEKGKSERINFDEKISFIYNGKYIAKENVTPYLKPSDGTVKIVDREKNGKADILYIENSVSYFVSDISPSNFIIFDKYGNENLIIDPSLANCTIEKDGSKIEITDILANDVLTVTKSLPDDGKSYIKIIVSREKFSGEITELSEDGIKIDGYEYKVSDSAKDELSKMNIGDRSMFYFTYDGKIAGLGRIVVGGLQYGYLVDGGMIKSGIGAENVATFRVFSLTERALVEFDTADKISLNGEYSDENGTYTGKRILEKLTDGGTVQHQLIQYTLDKNYKIKNINLAKDSRASIEGYDKDNFSLDYKFVSAKPTATAETYFRYYKTLSGGLIQNRYFTSTAVFLKVPAEDSETGKIDAEQIKVFSPDTLWENDYRIRNIELYDVNENSEAAVVIEQGTATDAGTTVHFVVDCVAKAIDSEGYPAAKIYGYYLNKYTSYTVSSDAKFDAFNMDVKRGDVIRVAINGRNEITNYVKLFTIREDAKDYFFYGDMYDDLYGSAATNSYEKMTMLMWNRLYKAAHVRCVGKSSAGLRVTLGKDHYRNIILPLQTAECVVYDEKSDKLRLGTKDDILPGDTKQTMFVRINYGGAAEIYVVNRAESIEPGSNISYGSNY